MEEFYESEMVWPEFCNSLMGPRFVADSAFRSKGLGNCQTPAVKIPAVRRQREEEYINEEEDELVESCKVMGITPPHVLASQRRAARDVAFSLCSGQGRTLKGRDLRHVRDSVLRMTGFLEGSV